MNTSRETITYSPHSLCLLALSLCAVVAYVYFLNMSVVHVVVQKQLANDMQDMKNEIALLESQYITAQHTITARMATIEGVSAERNKVFVARDSRDSLVVNE